MRMGMRMRRPNSRPWSLRQRRRRRKIIKRRRRSERRRRRRLRTRSLSVIIMIRRKRRRCRSGSFETICVIAGRRGHVYLGHLGRLAGHPSAGYVIVHGVKSGRAAVEGQGCGCGITGCAREGMMRCTWADRLSVCHRV